MKRVMTLCGECAQELKDAGFKRVEKIIVKTTTQKKDCCENCNKKRFDLEQYMVEGRG